MLARWGLLLVGLLVEVSAVAQVSSPTPASAQTVGESYSGV